MTDNFDFKPETLKKQEDEERKGGGFLPGLLSRLGLGGGGAAGAEAGLGGGGLLASKAGVVALLLAGTTVAAGIGMLGSGSRSPARTVSGGSVFSSGDKEGGIGGAGAQAEAQPASAASAGAAATSLDYLAQANNPAGGQEAASDGSAAVVDAPAADANAGSQAAAAEAAAASARVAAPRPQMAKSQGLSGLSSSSGGGGPRLEAQAGLGGSGFQNVYKAPPKGTSAMTAGTRSRMGATRLSAIRPGSTAAKQLAATSKVVKGNLRSGNVSSPGSGLTYDGGAGSVGSAGTPALGPGTGGQGVGGAGIDAAPGSNVAKDLREVQPPPEPVKNAGDQSPWKDALMMAVGALLIGAVLLMAASHFVKKAQAGDLTAYAAAKWLSMAATVCGVIAAGVGVMLISQYDQMAQGLMFTLSGGFLAFQAARVMMDSFAGEEYKANLESTIAKDPGVKLPDGFKVNVTSVEGNTATYNTVGSNGQAGVTGGQVQFTGTGTSGTAGNTANVVKIDKPMPKLGGK